MKKPRTPNTNVVRLDNYEDIVIYKKKLIRDKRLTNEEKGVLVQLIDSYNFYISARITAKNFNISEKHFRTMLNNFKSLGYLEINRIGNQYLYTFKQESKYIVDFKPYLVDQYTNTQLHALYHSADTPTKYKNLIKKIFDANNKDMETYNKVINEIKSFEMPKDIYKKQLEEETEQQNEIDLIEYLKNFK